jgi:hypothetical protein
MHMVLLSRVVAIHAIVSSCSLRNITLQAVLLKIVTHYFNSFYLTTVQLSDYTSTDRVLITQLPQHDTLYTLFIMYLSCL